jgi:WD40 repeat protein
MLLLLITLVQPLPEGATLRFGSEVRDVAWSPDGKSVATAGADKTVRVWSAADGKEVRVLRGHTGAVNSVRFSPDGKRLASGGADDTTRVWAVADGKEQLTLKPGGNDLYRCPAVFSMDGTAVAWGSSTVVHVADSTTGKEILKIDTKDHRVTWVEFCSDGKRLVSADGYGNVHVWEAWNGKAMPEPKNPSGSHATFSPDGKVLATCGLRQKLELWDVVWAKPVAKPDAGVAERSAFSPDSKRLATLHEAGAIRLWEVAGGAEIGKARSHGESVTTLAWSPDGSVLATAGKDGTVLFWSAK